LSSATSSGETVTSSYERLTAGARWRILPYGVEAPSFGVDGGFSHVGFGFGGSGTLLQQSPSVSYESLRAGADARFPFGPFAMLFTAGYDGPLSAGDVSNRFRGSNYGGVDVSAAFAWEFHEGFEARLTVAYDRYFYSFHPVPGDTFVAGGALDEFFGLRFGVAYAY
jgi:hypothetical protein